MDFKERLDLYLEGGMINENDVKDINNVIALFKDKYGVMLEEENAGMFIAHLCAAYSRLNSEEDVDDVPEELMKEIESLDSYEQSKKILEDVMTVTNNPLNEIEQRYALLHINTLIAQFVEKGEWHTLSEN